MCVCACNTKQNNIRFGINFQSLLLLKKTNLILKTKMDINKNEKKEETAVTNFFVIFVVVVEYLKQKKKEI